MRRRSWFAIEGSLEPIDYDGPSYFRFPEAVAEHVIERYSAPGDWIIDPFCGFGTTLVVAERLGRHAVGYEVDEPAPPSAPHVWPIRIAWCMVVARISRLPRGSRFRCCSPALLT